MPIRLLRRKSMSRLRKTSLVILLVVSITSLPLLAYAQNSTTHNPTWWDKYQYVANNAFTIGGASTASVTFGTNVDLPNECGPQSETFTPLIQSRTKMLPA